MSNGILSKYSLLTNILLISSPIYLLSSQNIRPRNGIYLECLGAGLLYSINYERFLSDNSTIRFGFTTFEIDAFPIKNFGLTAVPIMWNFLIGHSNHRAELGIGLEYTKFSGRDFWLTYSTYEGIIFVGSIGYRYQSPDDGMYYRLVANPIFRPKFSKSNIWLGISTGYSF